MDFYNVPTGKTSLRQGDLLYPVPFAVVSLNSSFIDGNKQQKTLSSDVPEAGMLAVPFESGWGMVIPQSCDSADYSGDLILIARVKPVTAAIKDYTQETKLNKVLKYLRKPASKPQYLY